MGNTTKIAWTDSTFNPWIGCTKVSQGCKFCYAELQNRRYGWVDKWGYNATRKRTSHTNWLLPVSWARKAAASGKKHRIFCASLADVFDPEVDNSWREDLWDLISYTSIIGGVEWQILTKRPENIKCMLPDEWLKNPDSIEYVRIGVTAEDQENADRRIPILLDSWSGKNFVSVEPMLGPVDLGWLNYQNVVLIDSLTGMAGFPEPHSPGHPKLDWVICGGESGPHCREMKREWATDLMNKCKSAGVAFFFKQLGGYPDKRDDPNDWPEELRIRQFP